MRKFIVIVLLLMLLFFLSFCKRKTECNAFSTEDMKDFPYKENTCLIFVNNENDTLKFMINSVETSDFYIIDKPDLNGINNCIRYAAAHITTSVDTTSSILLNLVITSVNDDYRYYYKLFGYSFEFDFENDAPYISYMPEFDSIGNFVIKDTTFTNVYRVNNSNFLGTNIKTVYFNKSSGIIRYDEYIGAKYWELQ